MCTLVIAKNMPESKWPLIAAFVRDEKTDRKYLSPGRHWENNQGIYAGIDVASQGTWLGTSNSGLFAALLNQCDTLHYDGGPSRGTIVLQALKSETIDDMFELVNNLNFQDYRGFNLIFGNIEKMYFATNIGRREIGIVPDGISMITAFGMNCNDCQRTKLFLSRFRKAKVPAPENNDWNEWLELLAEPTTPQNMFDGITIISDEIASVSTELLALDVDTNNNIHDFFPGSPRDWRRNRSEEI
ncbi:MAG: NRDE family protein [Negativicutes bacterium]|jgi:uncharacterized protein with NRDE domain